MLQDIDLMILSGLKACNQFSPDNSVHEICKTIVSTIRSNQNVIFPVYPSGVIFDLLEIISLTLINERLGGTPFYYIAPLAKDCGLIKIVVLSGKSRQNIIIFIKAKPLKGRFGTCTDFSGMPIGAKTE